MNEEKHFLKAISKGEPNADLIYADWLEEQGRSEADEIRDPAPVSFLDWSHCRTGSFSRVISQVHVCSISCSSNRFRSWSRGCFIYRRSVSSSHSQSNFRSSPY